MDITYLGHSSFKIKGKTISVVTDPYDSKMVGLKFVKTEADIVTVSHHHDDHNMISLVDEVKKTFDAPGEYEVGGVSFIGIPSFHDDQKGADRGQNTIFVIEMDGLRLCHLGDLGHTLSDSDVEEIGEIDILFVPVGGKYTIGSKIAFDVVNSIEPKIIIPMHYKTDGHNEEAFADLEPVENFAKLSGLKVESLPKLSIKAGEISPDEQIVYVLEKK